MINAMNIKTFIEEMELDTSTFQKIKEAVDLFEAYQLEQYCLIKEGLDPLSPLLKNAFAAKYYNVSGSVDFENQYFKGEKIIFRVSLKTQSNGNVTIESSTYW